MPGPVSLDRYRLACTIQANGLARLVRLLGTTAPESSILELPSMTGSAVRSSPAQPLVNHAVYSSAHAIPYQLPLLRSAYLRAGIRSWTLWVHHADLPEASTSLAHFGLRRFEAVPAMLLSPRKLRRVSRPTLEYDSDSGDLRTLGVVNESSYPDGVGIATALNGALPDDGFRVYRAWAHGEVVSTLLTVDHESPGGLDCGIYFVATLPSARRQGFTGRLLLAALADAFQRGCTSASLQASPMGERLYAALGFRTFFRFHTFRRQEPHAPPP